MEGNCNWKASDMALGKILKKYGFVIIAIQEALNA